MRRCALLTTLMISLLASEGRGDVLAAASPLALRMADLAPASVVAEGPAPMVTVMPAPALVEPTIAALSYRPRRSHPPVAPPPSSYPPPHSSYRPPPSAPRGPSGFLSLYGGIQDPDGPGGQGFTMGMRTGGMPAPPVKLGVALDWRHDDDARTVLVSEGVGPGGTPILVERQLSYGSSDLLPVMAMLQLSADPFPISPYVGAAGGYQWLFLTVDDYVNAVHFDATYGGWGWQGWGGVGIGLGGGVRLTSEVFWSHVMVHRDVVDVTGTVLRESVDMSGPGARVGLAMTF